MFTDGFSEIICILEIQIFSWKVAYCFKPMEQADMCTYNKHKEDNCKLGSKPSPELNQLASSTQILQLLEMWGIIDILPTQSLAIGYSHYEQIKQAKTVRTEASVNVGQRNWGWFDKPKWKQSNIHWIWHPKFWVSDVKIFHVNQRGWRWRWSGGKFLKSGGNEHQSGLFLITEMHILWRKLFTNITETN